MLSTPSGEKITCTTMFTSTSSSLPVNSAILGRLLNILPSKIWSSFLAHSGRYCVIYLLPLLCAPIMRLMFSAFGCSFSKLRLERCPDCRSLQQMALTNPEVASIAAVSPCLAALGKVSKGIATASQYEGAFSLLPSLMLRVLLPINTPTHVSASLLLTRHPCFMSECTWGLVWFSFVAIHELHCHRPQEELSCMSGLAFALCAGAL